MTVNEFSDAFDARLSSYSKQAEYTQQFAENDLVLDEYEKSVFLTEAQAEIVQSLYMGSALTESFEKTEAVRRQLDTLVKQHEYTTGSTEGIITDSFNHTVYTLPNDCWFIVYEQATTATSTSPCISEKALDILPVTHDDYNRVRKNPFRGPTKSRALRLDIGKLKVEIVSKYTLGKYLLRYLAKPTPIILTDLTETGLSIDGVSVVTECSLSDSIHTLILDRAIQLALQSKALTQSQQN